MADQTSTPVCGQSSAGGFFFLATLKDASTPARVQPPSEAALAEIEFPRRSAPTLLLAVDRTGRFANQSGPHFPPARDLDFSVYLFEQPLLTFRRDAERMSKAPLQSGPGSLRCVRDTRGSGLLMEGSTCCI